MFYKETALQVTAIGKIPRDWGLAELERITEIETGGNAPQGEEYFKDGKYPFVRVQHFNGNSIYVDKWDLINDKAVDECRLKPYPKDSIIFPKSGASINLDKRAMLPTESYVVSHLCILIPKTNIVDNRFLFYLMKRKRLSRYSAGTTLPYLNLAVISKLQCPLPSLPEQKKIAEVLSCVDLAIQKTDEAIAKTEKLKKGLMQQLLTKGIEHREFKETEIGKIPREWEVDTLPNLLNVIDYRGRTPPFSESGIPYLGSDNVRNERIVLDSRRYVSQETYEKYMTRGIPRPADILFTTEAPLGETALIPEGFRFCFAQRLVAFQCKPMLNPVFTMYMLRSKAVQKQLESWATGTTAKGISAKNMRFIKIPYPTAKTEQQKIADILLTVDKKLELERMEKTNLERVRLGLMDVLLSGKVRAKVD